MVVRLVTDEGITGPLLKQWLFGIVKILSSWLFLFDELSGATDLLMRLMNSKLRIVALMRWYVQRGLWWRYRETHFMHSPKLNYVCCPASTGSTSAHPQLTRLNDSEVRRLMNLFNAIRKFHYFSPSWKVTTVIPIPKDYKDWESSPRHSYVGIFWDTRVINERWSLRFCIELTTDWTVRISTSFSISVASRWLRFHSPLHWTLT